MQKVGGKELSWTKVAAPAFYVDFKELHPAQSEQVIAWAVAYVVCATEKSGLTLKMNSNDQGKVYLNGKELVKFTDTRSLEALKSGTVMVIAEESRRVAEHIAAAA